VTGTGAASTNIGGLVGLQFGTLANSYATGAVAGTGANSGNIGGLVGQSGGGISNVYATGAVTHGASGMASGVGGLVGWLDGDLTNAYATGAVSGGSADFVGGLVGYQTSGTINRTYATGAVSGGVYRGGLVGAQIGDGISNSYYDTQTTGQSVDVGNGANFGIGLTTAQFQSGSANLLTASSAWAGGANGLYPYLSSFFPNGVQAVSGIAYKDAGATLAASGVNGAVTETACTPLGKKLDRYG
jgi:hypothetical protein